jgi:hypothetical protein
MSQAGRLRRGIITSSSFRDLSDLLQELRFLGGEDVAFDLFLLRDTDISEIERRWGKNALKPPNGDQVDRRSLTSIMAESDNLPIVHDWLREAFRKVPGSRVSAFATYFPDISSAYESRRSVAVQAIINSVRLALLLKQDGIATSAIIELVGGSILDPCECESCRSSGTIFAFERKEKVAWVVEALRSVVSGLREQDQIDAAQAEVGLAIELEPGDTYLFNDLHALDQFFSAVDQDEVLCRVVGLNLDVAHMRIVPVPAMPRKGMRILAPLANQPPPTEFYSAKVVGNPEIDGKTIEIEFLEGPSRGESAVAHLDDCKPRFLNRHWRRILHGHISDHPHMHTRDQPVGKWTCVFRPAGGYLDYLRLLRERSRTALPGELPFSHTVALELEGCNRIRWVAESLVAIKQSLAMVELG